MLEHALDGLRDSGVVDSVVVAVPPNRTDEAKLVFGGRRGHRGGRSRSHGVRPARAGGGRRREFVLVHDAATGAHPALADRAGGAGAAGRSSPRWCPACRSATPSRPSTPTASCSARPSGRGCGPCRPRRDSRPKCCGAPTTRGRRRRSPTTPRWSSDRHTGAGGRGRPAGLQDHHADGSAAGPGPAGTGHVSMPRVGVGTDVHPIEAGRPCWLLGLLFEGADGCAGHSDGDVGGPRAVRRAAAAPPGSATSARCSAPTTRRWAGVSGADMLRHVHGLVRAEGYRVGNAAVQVIGNRPKVGPRRAEAQQVLSELLGRARFRCRRRPPTASG